MIGINTMRAIDNYCVRHGADKLAATICDTRLAYVKTLDIFKNFGKGWTRRITKVKARSVKLAREQGVQEVDYTPDGENGLPRAIGEQTVTVLSPAVDAAKPPSLVGWVQLCLLSRRL